MDYVKKNIVNFKDFSKEEEKQELTKLKRGFVKKRMKLISFPNSKYKFNKVTRKMDELSLIWLRSIEEMEERMKVNILTLN
jgi:hypothetical protein